MQEIIRYNTVKNSNSEQKGRKDKRFNRQNAVTIPVAIIIYVILVQPDNPMREIALIVGPIVFFSLISGTLAKCCYRYRIQPLAKDHPSRHIRESGLYVLIIGGILTTVVSGPIHLGYHRIKQHEKEETYPRVQAEVLETWERTHRKSNRPRYYARYSFQWQGKTYQPTEYKYIRSDDPVVVGQILTLYIPDNQPEKAFYKIPPYPSLLDGTAGLPYGVSLGLATMGLGLLFIFLPGHPNDHSAH